MTREGVIDIEVLGVIISVVEYVRSEQLPSPLLEVDNSARTDECMTTGNSGDTRNGISWECLYMLD